MRNGDRTANRDELRPLLVEQLADAAADGVVRPAPRAGVPCGPINTIDDGSRGQRFGLEPVVEVGEGDRACPRPDPIRFSATPVGYALPPPELDEHRASWPGCRPNVMSRYLTEPGPPTRRALGAVDAGHDHAARPGPGPRRDGRGRLRRAGLLAGHPAPPRAGERASSRRCWPRSPTTASRRPPSSPGSPGCRRPTGPGRAGRRAARRRLPVPRRHRGLRPVPPRRA